MELYLLHSKLILHFLHRLGFANSFKRSLIDENIEKLEKKYVDYISKFTPDAEAEEIEETQKDGEHDSLLSEKKDQ